MPRKDAENHCEATEPREAVMYGSDLATICSKSPTEVSSQVLNVFSYAQS